MNDRILLTGGNGFVGSSLCKKLLSQKRQVTSAVRNASEWKGEDDPRLKLVSVGNIDAHTDWLVALEGCDRIVHLAARAHVLHDESKDALLEFRKTNVDGTVQLARMAKDAGVKRFVYVSSIGVNGSVSSRPYHEDDIPIPVEPYAVSKLESELALQELCKNGEMELVIVRPPLVYGPGCPGNFLRLMKLVESGLPLPFGSIHNRRSFVGVSNLVDLLTVCLFHPDASGRIFLASDMEDVSLPELLRILAKGMGKSARLIAVPAGLVLAAARALNKAGVYEKLCGNLTVDASSLVTVLGWKPPIRLEEGLLLTARWYMDKYGVKR